MVVDGRMGGDREGGWEKGGEVGWGERREGGRMG